MTYHADLAGSWYADDPDALFREIDRYLAAASLPEDLSDVFGIVAPHAGLAFSGPVAGYAYRAVQGRNYELIVVLGVAHRAAGAAGILDVDTYRTPLGSLAIDRATNGRLLEALSFLEADQTMFRRENSIELQMPFLKRLFPTTPVVLLSIGQVGERQIAELAEALDRLLAGRRVLFVASTDLTHFLTRAKAARLDGETLDYLANNDLAGLRRLPHWPERMCGRGPVSVLFELYRRRGGRDVRRLCYQDSGAVSGDTGNVVGYGALALTLPAGAPPTAPSPNEATEAGESFLTIDQKTFLLRVARETIEQLVKTGKKPDFQVEDDKLRQPGAAFVTLHKQPRGQLRGCIGQVVAREPLWLCVRDMAVAAATQDPRFSKVKRHELADLRIEISVLTPAEPVRDVTEIQVGVHGLIVGRGWSRGLLLPQVPTEYGWDRETFLTQTCRKAGLPGDCWRDAGTTIEKFTAVVFSE